MRKPTKISLLSIPVEGAHDGAGRRQLIFSPSDDVSQYFQAMTKGYLDPGAVFDWHQHDGVDELFVVLKGTGTVSYRSSDGGITNAHYHPGDALYMPAGIQHRIDCLGDEISEYFFVRLSE